MLTHKSSRIRKIFHRAVGLMTVLLNEIKLQAAFGYQMKSEEIDLHRIALNITRNNNCKRSGKFGTKTKE
jgi:hypothetical protein